MTNLARALTTGAVRAAPQPRRPSGLPRPVGRISRREDHVAERGRDPLEGPFHFVATQGLVAPGVLLAAHARARRLGVGLDETLIASGALDELSLTRGFARRWRLPFLPTPTLHDETGPGVFAAGMARCAAAPQMVAAPCGPRATALAQAAARLAGAPDARLAVVPAKALRAAAFACLAPRLAREAAATLPDALSARLAELRPMQAAALILTAAAVACALAPVGLAGAVGAAFVSLLFLVAVVARLTTIMAAADEPPDAVPLADAQLPRYAVVVAMHREENVVADLVAAMARLDYPREKHRVSFVVEEDDAPTRAALAALDLPPNMEVVVVAPGRPRTKPRALNVALAACDAEMFVIYDAEDRPDPDQLRKAAARFTNAPARVACLQARLAIDNARENLLTRLFALDYAGLFEVLNPGLAALDWPMLLGGTSNHFRVAALRAARGWDAWNVTEDADLGLRLARAGYSVETLRSTTWEEAPNAWRAWFSQRRRWLKGWMQTALVHSREPRQLWRQLGPERALAIFAMLGGGLLSALTGPFFALRVALDAARGDLLRVATPLDVVATSLTLMLIATGLVCAILPAFIAARRAGGRDLAPFAAVLPVYYLLVSWAAWRALIELIHAPHVWSKTRHGVSQARKSPA